jgi:hypothetical protein
MSLEGRTTEEINALAELASTLATNPKTRNGFLQLTKTANPDTAIPEIDIPQQLSSHFKPHLDRLAELEKAHQQRELQAKIEEGRKKALQVKGMNENDLPALEKMMVEKQLVSHETAAEFLMASRKAAEPTPAAFHQQRKFTVPSTPDLKEFGGNLRAHAQQQAYQVIDELRGRRPS